MFQETKELSTSSMQVSLYHEMAESIRRGCVRYPRQAFGSLYDESEKAACVLGAMVVGGGCASFQPVLGLQYNDSSIQVVAQMPAFCPHCRYFSAVVWTLESLLVHLNDL